MKKNLKISSLAMLMGASLVLSSCPGMNYDIVFWTGFGSSYTGALETLLDEYSELSQLSIYHESKGGYDNLQSAINNSVSQNAFPNMANGYPDHFAGYISSQIMIPLDDYITAYDAEHGTDLLNDYYADYMLENQTLYEDYTMGVPFNKSTEVMAYNLTLLEALDTVDDTIIEGDEFVAPKTWDEMATLGRKIIPAMQGFFGKIIGTDYKVYDTEAAVETAGVETAMDLRSVTADKFRVFSWDSAANMFITLVRQWGSEYTEVNEYGQGTVQFYSTKNDNANRTLEMSKYWRNLYREGIFGFPTDMGGTSDYSSDQFKAGNCIFTICSSGGLSYNSGGNGEVHLAPIPYNVTNYDGEGEVVRKYVISQGTSLGLFDQGDEEDIQNTFDLIVWLSTGEAQAKWSVTTGYYPASKSATETDTYKNFIAADPSTLTATQVLYQESFTVNEENYMLEETADEVAWVKFVDPGFIGSSQIRLAVDNVMAQVFMCESEDDIPNVYRNLYTGSIAQFVPVEDRI